MDDGGYANDFGSDARREAGVDDKKLRSHFARALADAESRAAMLRDPPGHGFGEETPCAISDVECHIFWMFGIELGKRSPRAPHSFAACHVMIWDAEQSIGLTFGQGSATAHWTADDPPPNPTEPLSSALSQATRAAGECEAFVCRREQLEIHVAASAPTANNRRVAL